MASSSSLHFFLLFPLIFLISGSLSHNPILPKAAVFQVRKDPSTLQYVASVFMGENLAPVKLVVDLNGPFVWVDCEYSRSHNPVKSCSLKCSMAKPIKGCYRPNGNGVEYTSRTCTLQAENTISRMSTSGDLNEDTIAMEFLDGLGLAKTEKFLISCAPNLLLKGLANGAKGMLGLGNSRISLPSQFSTTFGFFHRNFFLCLSPSNGAIFLGGNPYESETSSSMMYTPLISKKNGLLQEGYYIDVSSIKVSGKKLSSPQKGLFLRTKISTVVPYTTMESNIYTTFVEAFVNVATSLNFTLVPSVAPFEVCFSSKETILPNLPIIDLVLQSEMVKWRIHSKNSMVHISNEIMCLGFLDGGLSPRDSIVIGGYQIEDYILEFNLGNSMLGFSSLSLVDKKCSDFEASSPSKELF